MKKRIFWMILIITVMNTRLVIQPDCNHYVIGSRLGDINFVLSSERVETIWIGDTMYSLACDEAYENQ